MCKCKIAISAVVLTGEWVDKCPANSIKKQLHFDGKIHRMIDLNFSHGFIAVGYSMVHTQSFRITK